VAASGGVSGSIIAPMGGGAWAVTQAVDAGCIMTFYSPTFIHLSSSKPVA
jgi:hypothetical protein